MSEKSPIINLIKKVSPAVVSIVISKELSKIQWAAMGMPAGAPDGIADQLEYTDVDHKKVKVGGGSGFFVSADGVVLTNRHVVADADAEYTVVTTKGEKFSTKVLVRDPINDLAILQVNAKGFPIIKLGNSSQLQLGQTTVAIGNALGEFQNTVSVGVISGLSRFITAHDQYSEETRRLRGLIQTDAAINPGNSGGPLLDIDGRVIGINSAVIFGASNIGFAIPVNAAKKDLEQLRRFGHLRQASLGVRYIMLTKDLQRIAKFSTDTGALILREQGPGGDAVVKGSCADKAGIKENDIIVEFNGTPINETNRLDDLVSSCEVGQAVSLKILRKGKEKVVSMKMGERG